MLIYCFRKAILTTDAGIHDENITVFKYRVEDGKGEGLIVVDNREPPAKLYARGY